MPTVLTRLFPWLIRVVWVALPFALGPALGSALLHHSAPVRNSASTALWAVWAVTVVATLVPHPVSLTILRCVAPAAVVAAAAAGFSGDPSSVAIAVGLAWSTAVAALVFLPATSLRWVNGPAYPNELRFPLSPPGALVLGPIELAWAATIGLPSVAVLLLASRQWLAGGATSVFGVAAIAVFGRALHGLSRRWVVLVPAGLVLHDPLSLVDPVLFRRPVVERLWPAPADSDALDLSQRALGLALELVLTEKVPLVRITPAHRRGEAGASARLLFTPTRPGSVLAEASARRLPVGLSR